MHGDDRRKPWDGRVLDRVVAVREQDDAITVDARLERIVQPEEYFGGDGRRRDHGRGDEDRPLDTTAVRPNPSHEPRIYLVRLRYTASTNISVVQSPLVAP